MWHTSSSRNSSVATMEQLSEDGASGGLATRAAGTSGAGHASVRSHVPLASSRVQYRGGPYLLLHHMLKSFSYAVGEHGAQELMDVSKLTTRGVKGSRNKVKSACSTWCNGLFQGMLEASVFFSFNSHKRGDQPTSCGQCAGWQCGGDASPRTQSTAAPRARRVPSPPAGVQMTPDQAWASRPAV